MRSEYTGKLHMDIYDEGYKKGFLHGIWTCSFIVLLALLVMLWFLM